jgi:hypothetical protein
MKYIVYILSFLLILSIQSCSQKKYKSKQIFEHGKTISISYNPDNYSPLDSFVSKITIVPLETNDNCLIGQQNIRRVMVHKGLIYMNYNMRQLLVFDINGKYIREIGRRGQGPGELNEIRDFDITDEGVIDILGYKRIESFTLEGTHISTKKFDFTEKNFHCNPCRFCRSSSSSYYLWGGLTGIMDNEELRAKCSLMYRTNSKLKIEEGFFSTYYGDGGIVTPFSSFHDTILVTPSAYDYNIYQIDPNDSIRIRYSFDFEKYCFDSSKKVDRKYIAREKYISEIMDFNETERFIYFRFLFQNYFRNFLFSKKTEQFYIQMPLQSINRKDFNLILIKGMYNDQLIGMVDVVDIKEYLEHMSQENIQKWGLEELHKLDDEDNPVLIFYTIKL